MWRAALETEALQAALAGAGAYEQRILRLFGPPESEIAKTLREAERDGIPLERLEITTCLRRGEIEIATVFEPSAAEDYAAFEAAVLERHGKTVFARDGETIDELVAGALLGPPVRTVAVAESCTGGLMAGRLTDRGGSSTYVLGGLTVYSNEAKVALAGAEPGLIERHGAVSSEVAVALADGAIERLGADLGIGITGIAGPGGGSEAKPVGTVCLSVAERGGARIDRTLQLPGNRAMVRERTTTVAMHLLRRLLDGAGRLTGSSSRSTCPRRRGPRSPSSLRDAEADPGLWRPVPDEALHVTLVFLGHRPPGESDAVAAVLRECAGAAPDLALGAALLLPPRRPRVLCAEVEDRSGTLAELQARVSAGLAAAGLHEPERRATSPHATVARLRAGVPRAAAGTARRGRAPVSFAGEAVTLYRSRLSRAGAAYEPLERIAVA